MPFGENAVLMRLKTVLKEPLLHFLALGAALFLFFQWRGGPGPGSNRIVVTPGQIDRLTSGYAQVWQRPPTETDLKGLVDDWVKEEIAVREATAAGLDRDDTIIRRRLRQKLELLAEDAAAAVPPTDSELQAYLASHADAFRAEPKLAIRQVTISRDKRGPSAEADARTLLARLKAEGPKARTDRLGDAALLPQEMELSTNREVARIFGSDFAQALEKAPTGIWWGPVASGFGLHLVLVTERVEGSAPALAAVRPAVESEFLAERRKRRLATLYESLLAKYKVVVETREAGGAGEAKKAGGS